MSTIDDVHFRSDLCIQKMSREICDFELFYTNYICSESSDLNVIVLIR